MTLKGELAPLVGALQQLRDRLAGCSLPLELPGVPAARDAQAALVAQLDDYVLPRLRQLDAPLLAVVGGSTGAGKSTIVNSIVRSVVSPAGVLRPTTRAPVLVTHPNDQESFAGQRVLPSFARSTGATGDPGTLHVVCSPSLEPGLALLDAPDIDSVVTENRELANQLLAAADLWIFVTTAARYADAVPWDLLHTARERSTALAAVLNRVSPDAIDEVSADFAAMLAAQGLGDAPLFVVPEIPQQGGLLPDPALRALRSWLESLAADAAARNDIIRRTLDGALASLPARVGLVAEAAVAQVAAAGELRAAVSQAYGGAAADIDEGMSDGSVLRGEVLARWQEFVGTGEILRSLEAQIGRLRDRISAAFRGRPDPGVNLQVALDSAVTALIVAAADGAAERSEAAWRQLPAGRGLLAAGPSADLARSSPDLVQRADRLVRDWQAGVLDLVRREGAGKRASARFLSFGVNGIGLLVMVAVFASTGGLTGAEVVVAGGTSALAQKLLEAIFGDQAVRRLAATARDDLRVRVEELLGEEADRFRDLVDNAGIPSDAAPALRDAMAKLARAR
jgi:hypothetical protein